MSMCDETFQTHASTHEPQFCNTGFSNPRTTGENKYQDPIFLTNQADEERRVAYEETQNAVVSLRHCDKATGQSELRDQKKRLVMALVILALLNMGLTLWCAITILKVDISSKEALAAMVKTKCCGSGNTSYEDTSGSLVSQPQSQQQRESDSQDMSPANSVSESTLIQCMQTQDTLHKMLSNWTQAIESLADSQLKQGAEFQNIFTTITKISDSIASNPLNQGIQNVTLRAISQTTDIFIESQREYKAVVQNMSREVSDTRESQHMNQLKQEKMLNILKRHESALQNLAKIVNLTSRTVAHTLTEQQALRITFNDMKEKFAENRLEQEATFKNLSLEVKTLQVYNQMKQEEFRQEVLQSTHTAIGRISQQMTTLRNMSLKLSRIHDFVRRTHAKQDVVVKDVDSLAKSQSQANKALQNLSLNVHDIEESSSKRHLKLYNSLKNLLRNASYIFDWLIPANMQCVRSIQDLSRTSKTQDNSLRNITWAVAYVKHLLTSSREKQDTAIRNLILSQSNAEKMFQNMTIDIAHIFESTLAIKESRELQENVSKSISSKLDTAQQKHETILSSIQSKYSHIANDLRTAGQKHEAILTSVQSRYSAISSEIERWKTASNTKLEGIKSVVSVFGGPLVRLVNSDNLYSGRVEIFYRGRWGTICDDGWDTNDGRVICRMLGYRSISSAPLSAHFGQGTGPITMDDVACSGSETSIWNCRHGGLMKHNCGHSEDASVVCQT